MRRKNPLERRPSFPIVNHWQLAGATPCIRPYLSSLRVEVYFERKTPVFKPKNVASSLLEARRTAGTYPITEQELLGLWLLLLGLVGCGDFGVKGDALRFAQNGLRHRR